MRDEKNRLIKEVYEKELLKLENRRNIVKERDLIQLTKSQLRKQDLIKISIWVLFHNLMLKLKKK